MSWLAERQTGHPHPRCARRDLRREMIMGNPSRAAPNRLSSGGLIDRKRRLHFSFDGRTYSGYAGDTLASALLGNGVKLLGRSFKYHRPRGLLTAGSEEPNALVELRRGAH